MANFNINSDDQKSLCADLQIYKYPSLLFLNEKLEFSRFHLKLNDQSLAKYIVNPPFENLQLANEGNIDSYFKQKKSNILLKKILSLEF